MALEYDKILCGGGEGFSCDSYVIGLLMLRVLLYDSIGIISTRFLLSFWHSLYLVGFLEAYLNLFLNRFSRGFDFLKVFISIYSIHLGRYPMGRACSLVFIFPLCIDLLT